MADIKGIKELVLEGWKVLVSQGLMDYLGHVSARVPGQDKVVIKPILTNYDSVTAEDMVVVDLEARKLEGRHMPHRETILHTSIYKARPDVGGVVHAHPRALNALSACSLSFKPISNAGAVLGSNIPLYQDYRLVTEVEQGEALAKTLGNHIAVVMVSHGAVTVGPDVRFACLRMIELGKEASTQVLSRSVGNPVPIPDEYCEERIVAFKAVDTAWSYFTALASGKLRVSIGQVD